MIILIGIFIFMCGVGAGLITGRLFCKWHHRNDTQTDEQSAGCCQEGTCDQKGGCCDGE